MLLFFDECAKKKFFICFFVAAAVVLRNDEQASLWIVLDGIDLRSNLKLVDWKLLHDEEIEATIRKCWIL